MRSLVIHGESLPFATDYYSEAGILKMTGSYLQKAGLREPFFLITSAPVGRLYGNMLKDAIRESGASFTYVEIPDGERYKTLFQVRKIYDHMAKALIDRSSTVVALGGGVVCDMAGFAASTFMRGIPHAFIPTTLLAQVDASIGGKTGVDLPPGKNLIGSFYHPHLILCDSDLLKTLRRRHFACGVAEIIKSALISSEEFFRQLQAHCPLSPGHSRLEEIIYETAMVKASLVMKDPFEKGERVYLNFGHTIGHALESAGGFRKYLHGEAISIGMVGACMLSEELGCLPRGMTGSLASLLLSSGLPVKYRGVDSAAIESALKWDKKKMKELRFVLIKKPGEPFVTGEVPLTLIRKVLNNLSES